MGAEAAVNMGSAMVSDSSWRNEPAGQIRSDLSVTTRYSSMDDFNETPRTTGDQHPETVERILHFLLSIGLPFIERPTTGSPLLPGVAIEAGQLVIDRSRLLWAGDLLHEAGHLAVLPAALRRTFTGELPPDLEVPFAGEPEATAWAYAASVAIGLEPRVLFHRGGYHGKSEHLAFTYSAGCYPGAGGLCAAGMSLSAEDARRSGKSPYPHIQHWLRS